MAESARYTALEQVPEAEAVSHSSTPVDETSAREVSPYSSEPASPERSRSSAIAQGSNTHRRTSSVKFDDLIESEATAPNGTRNIGRRGTFESIRSTELEDDIIFDLDDEDPFSTTPGYVPNKNQWMDQSRSTNRILVAKLFLNVAYILLWYTFSLSLSLYNKWMFSDTYLNFKFPLFATSCHMAVQTLLASLILLIFPQFRPPADSRMSWKTYILNIGSCGLATAGDIGLGNMSLRFITLGFYTMVKSSNLVFVLLFAFLFRLERPTFQLVAIITVMTIGVVMMVASETQFVLIGFVLVLIAAVLSGFRWSVTQMLLKHNPATANPFSTIFYLAPVMCLFLFVLACSIEGFSSLIHSPVWSQESPILWILILLTPGVIAFLMTAAEFMLLHRTNVVTLSIVGIFKEVLTIIVSAGIYGDSLTVINISGLVVTLIAIAAYNYIRIRSMRQKIRNQQFLGSSDSSASSSRGQESRIIGSKRPDYAPLPVSEDLEMQSLAPLESELRTNEK
ncbi:triose-phosphate transporter family-domain-containing protein [Lipomyces oligophaga]|uniref:triose-phosphate transporter family-domain-containing protein n=1 Tax=Lipomyces oligophaga TaxID=45792 RepID=UPI0034CDA944